MSKPVRCVLWLLVISCQLSRSQGNLGAISGQIADASGGAIAGAAIRVTNLDTDVSIEISSSQTGDFLAGGLTPGRYGVTVSKPGFSSAVRRPVLVSTASVSKLDVVMEIGATTQSMVVSADVASLQTDSPEIGTVLPQKQILDLPISLGGSATIGASGRRQIENFTFLTPGVTGNQWSKSINGAPGFSQEILYDGGDAQNIGAPGFIAESSPPYEAIAEFKVQNTLYPAEYGFGFGVENFTFRSGANQFHGDAFDFLRNDKLNARGFFAGSRPIVRQNEYGGTFGGPVIVPKYNGRDRTFFFFAYSGFQLRGGSSQAGLVSVPSLQERNGDFSDFPNPIYDPATTRPDGRGNYVRDRFPGNIIPQNRISDVAKRTLALLPNPDRPGYFNNYIDRSKQPTSENAYSVRLDHSLSEKNRLSGSFWWVDGTTHIYGPVAGLLDFSRRDTTTSGGGVRVNLETVLTPTKLNHANFSYTPTSPTWAHWLADPHKGNQVLQIPGVDPNAPGFPEFDIEGYQTLGNARNQAATPQDFKNWNGSDTFTWVEGIHQIKAGVTFRHREMVTGDQGNQAGTFQFVTRTTSNPDDPNYASYGNGFASFLLGNVLSASHFTPAPISTWTDNYWTFHAEDAIKLRANLTLTLGLRYELPFYPRAGEGGNLSSVDLSKPNPAAGGRLGALRFSGKAAGASGSFNALGKNYRNAFAPRLGLAYSVDKGTVVRLGYGIFYDYPGYGRLNNGGYWGNGFGYTQSVASTDQGLTPALNLDAGFPNPNVSLPNTDPSLLNNGAGIYINSQAFKPARMQSWTVDVERALPWKITADAAYVGAHTTGLSTGLESPNQVDPKYLSLGATLLADINSPEAKAAGIVAPYPGFKGSVAQALRPYPQYTSLADFYQPTGQSTYQALQVRIQRSFSQGLAFLLSYTLSKTLGSFGGDTFGDSAGGGGSGAMDTFNRKLEKALAPTDQTHVIVLSWDYELPFGKGRPFLSSSGPVVNALFGGWQVNAIQSYSSGTPIGISGGSTLPLFNSSNRPNWISSKVRTSVPIGSFDPARDRYLDINAFSQPGPFSFGNAPRRLPNVRVPFRYNEDFSAFKRFGITESSFVEFRAEFFNIFNRVVFGGPASNVNSPSTFGRIGSQANTPRVIQGALKFIF